MNRKEVLGTAERYVSNDRNTSYGEPEDSFRDIADLWNVYWGGADREFTAGDVAMFNILLKVARLKSNPTHLDSIIDICGYAACLGEIVSKEPAELTGDFKAYEG